jgi:copper chaperone CopZ
MKKTELSIGGMSCGHSVAKVKNAISNVKGVLKAEVSLKPKNTIVRLRCRQSGDDEKCRR